MSKKKIKGGARGQYFNHPFMVVFLVPKDQVGFVSVIKKILGSQGKLLKMNITYYLVAQN